MEGTYIVTLTEVQEYLGITSGQDEALLESFIKYATAKIETYTDRIIVPKAIEEYPDPDNFKDLEDEPMLSLAEGMQYLVTNNAPVSGLKMYSDAEGTEIDSSSYRAELETGIIALEGVSKDDVYKITYTAGYGTMPDDLKDVALQMITEMYKNHGATKGKLDISSKRLGNYAVTYAKAKVNAGDYSEVLDKYKKVNI